MAFKKPEIRTVLVQVNFSSKFIASPNKAEKTKTRQTKRPSTMTDQAADRLPFKKENSLGKFVLLMHDGNLI